MATLLEKQAFELHEKLGEMTYSQFWTIASHRATVFRNKERCRCSHCGHEWRTQDETVGKCPLCGFEADERRVTRIKHNHDEVEFAMVIQKFRGWQVIRLFCVQRRGQSYDGKYRTSVYVDEVRQQWLNPDGGSVYISRHLKMYPNYSRNPFNEYSPFIIRGIVRGEYYNSFDITNIRVDYLFVQSLADRFRYCGITAKSESFQKYCPEELVEAVLGTYLSEPLIKQGSIDVLMALYFRGYFDNDGHYKDRVAALKIAMRHKMFVPPVSRTMVYDWADHIRMLMDVGYDVHNPFYVAPENFREAHDKLIRKVNKIDEERRRKERRERDLAEEGKFYKMRHKFLDLVIKSDGITIMPLHSISEFYEEGQRMHNCVYGYRLIHDSLILSARIGDDWSNPTQRVETIEVDLTSYKVVQARGLQNQLSDYHDLVLKIMENNMQLIKDINEKEKCDKESTNAQVA